MARVEAPKNPVLRRALEQKGARASIDAHQQAAERIIGFLDPVLSALSVPESSTVRLEGQPSGVPYTRRILSYPPLLERVGRGENRQDYYVSVADGKLANGVKMPLTLTTGDKWEDIPMGSVVDNEGYLNVRNALGNVANLAEVEDLVNLARWISSEAPRQAVYDGNISPSWMNRYMLNELHGGYPFYEGLPRENGLGRNGLYEVIRASGGRAVCRLYKDNQYGAFWVNDVTGTIFTEQVGAIAWRDVTSDKPGYYLEAKHPDLHKKS